MKPHRTSSPRIFLAVALALGIMLTLSTEARAQLATGDWDLRARGTLTEAGTISAFQRSGSLVISDITVAPLRGDLRLGGGFRDVEVIGDLHATRLEMSRTRGGVTTSLTLTYTQNRMTGDIEQFAGGRTYRLLFNGARRGTGTPAWPPAPAHTVMMPSTPCSMAFSAWRRLMTSWKTSPP